MQRKIEYETEVPASIDKVWELWTTESGATSFFAPKATVELAIGGRYEMLFDLDMPPGLQGGEGLKILSYLPQEMLSFEWNAPPHLPTVRDEKTWVVILFQEQSAESTLLKFTHLGWGSGGEWDQAYDYFVRAWQVVLARLVYSTTNGPIDWDNPYRPGSED